MNWSGIDLGDEKKPWGHWLPKEAEPKTGRALASDTAGESEEVSKSVEVTEDEVPHPMKERTIQADIVAIHEYNFMLA